MTPALPFSGPLRPGAPRPLALQVALCLGAALFLTGCGVKAQPALDSELYRLYQGAELTAMREGLLAYLPDRRRGTEYECFPRQSGRAVGGLEFGASLAPGTEFIRTIPPGERIFIEELVYFDRLPGLWARARLGTDGRECIIGAQHGLKLHLLLTGEEVAQWNALPESVRLNIIARQIQAGMSRAQVMISWGPPFKRIQNQDAAGTAETWIYQKGERRLVYLNFQGDSLTGWRE